MEKNPEEQKVDSVEKSSSSEKLSEFNFEAGFGRSQEEIREALSHLF